MRLRNSVSSAFGTLMWNGRMAFEFSFDAVASPLAAIAGIAATVNASDATALRAVKFRRVLTREVVSISLLVFIVFFRLLIVCRTGLTVSREACRFVSLPTN